MSYYDKLGFGHSPQIGFPGAVAGRLRPAKNWRPIEQATMSYGHGVTVSLLQQVRAYTVFARDGDMIELSIYKDRAYREPQRVYSAKTAGQMRDMVANVVEKGGTGFRARVEGYTAAGKTGTAYKVEGGQYVRKYVAGFAGYAPAHNPQIVVGIMIDEPMIGKHFGSTAAAPLFSEMVSKTLRLMAVNPDRPEDFMVTKNDKKPAKAKAQPAKTHALKESNRARARAPSRTNLKSAKEDHVIKGKTNG